MKAWKLGRDVELRPILVHCLQVDGVDRLILALRQDQDGTLLYPEMQLALERIFGSHILELKTGKRWPGTDSTMRDCNLAVIEVDASLIAPMCSAGPKLFDWTGWPAPVLPEDLCLYRQGAEWPSLMSVTHEHDAWILAQEKPELIDGEEEEFRPAEFHIPPASEGFIL